MTLVDTDAGAIAEEYCALADLLESSASDVWDAPTRCEGWRTREVVAHVTMPARYSGPEFMKELEAAGGDFTVLSNAVAARDGALPTDELLACLRSEALHGWQPPGGGSEGALTHCVIHQLDIVEAVPLARRVPEDRIFRVLSILTAAGAPNPFGTDLSGVELRADDLEWSHGSGEVMSGPAQVLALVVCGRTVPAARLCGDPFGRFSR